MNNHRVIRTPIDTVNIFGAGGIRQGSIAEIYGFEKSGKSTFSYQTGGLFLKDNPQGVVHIIDVENSVDLLRLREVFKYEMRRVKVHHCRTLESAFSLLNRLSEQLENQSIGKFKVGKKEFKILTKEKLEEMDDNSFFMYCDEHEIKETDRLEAMDSLLVRGLIRGNKDDDYMTPIFAIWDTIAVSKPKVEYEAAMKGEDAMNAGGLGMKARVIELHACALLASMGGKPYTVFVLNQIRLTGFGSWTGPSETSSGGNALKHNCHYRFKFTQLTTKDIREGNYNEAMGGKTGTTSKVTLEKAKFCPITQDIEIYINDQLGGVIVPSEELAKIALKIGLIEPVRGPAFIFKDHPETKFTWLKESKTEGDKYISNNPQVRNHLMQEITKHYRKSYFTMDHLYRDVGLEEFGKPSEEEMREQRTVEDECILNELNSVNPFVRV